MRGQRPAVHALVAAGLAAMALLATGAPRAASAQPAGAVRGAPCPTPAQVACRASDACLQARIQELARLSDTYVPMLQEATHHPLLYQEAQPLLRRWETIRRLAALGPRAPRVELCAVVGSAPELIEQSHNFRMRLPLARDVGPA